MKKFFRYTRTAPSTPRGAMRTSIVLAAMWMLAGCATSAGESTLGYYWQSMRGHVDIMTSARPLQDWIDDPGTSPALRQRLELAQKARAFAVEKLGLPDNASYHRYAHLGRSAAVWNVVAAEPFSIKLHTWCFPVTGCIGYRGYFDEAGAKAEAARMAEAGLEISVYPVPAYSTLGYLNWLGGDPLLNTFVGWPEGDFVRLLFHELAHQVVYASGDTAFNESYATAVERIGVARWLEERSSPKARADFASSEKRRAQFRALTQTTRARLAKVYESDESTDIMAVQKSRTMQQFADDYAALRVAWVTEGIKPEQLTNLDEWVKKANNASFGAQGAYDDLVPAFTALFEKEGRDWTRFHAAVKQLAAKPRDERHAALEQLMPASHLASQPSEKSAYVRDK